MGEPRILQTEVPPGLIDLGLGNPALDLLPLDIVKRSAGKFFAATDNRPLQYGLEQGDGYFRLALAAFLAQAYNAPVEPEQLFVTAGASDGLDLLCTLTTHPGEAIFVEEPSYFLALKIFADHGLRLIPIPMDTEGLCIEALDELLAVTCPKFIYIVPTFQNPSGRTLSQRRREMLIERAQQHNFIVIADEVYQFLSYGEAPPRPFALFSESVEQVVSLNSFSKILAPGLRLGWIQAHEAVLRRLAGSGLLDSGGGMNPLMSALARSLIESGGLAVNIAALRREYTARLKALDAALHQHLPTAEYELPEGGFFFWVRLPGMNATALRHKAQAAHVDFRPGDLFSSQQGMQDHARLSFSYYSPEILEEGVRRLANCLAAVT
jgi:2-aminoadipate transaminase